MRIIYILSSKLLQIQRNHVAEHVNKKVLQGGSCVAERQLCGFMDELLEEAVGYVLNQLSALLSFSIVQLTVDDDLLRMVV
jgi:hypothetical protein